MSQPTPNGPGTPPPQTFSPAARSVDELVVGYDSVPTWDRISRRRRMLRGRLIGLGITVALLTAFTIWQREQTSLTALIVGNAIILGLSLVAVGVTWWLLRRARSAVSTLGEGTVLRIRRVGIELVGRRTRWEQLVGLDVVKGPLALGPRLRLRDRSGGEITVPLDQLDLRPGSLDGAVRAYSGGRHGVDLSGLDA